MARLVLILVIVLAFGAAVLSLVYFVLADRVSVVKLLGDDDSYIGEVDSSYFLNKYHPRINFSPVKICGESVDYYIALPFEVVSKFRRSNSDVIDFQNESGEEFSIYKKESDSSLTFIVKFNDITDEREKNFKDVRFHLVNWPPDQRGPIGSYICDVSIVRIKKLKNWMTKMWPMLNDANGIRRMDSVVNANNMHILSDDILNYSDTRYHGKYNSPGYSLAVMINSIDANGYNRQMTFEKINEDSIGLIFNSIKN